MANAVATVTSQYVNQTLPGRAGSAMLNIWGTVAIGANPLQYVAGGIAMSFAGIDDVKTGAAPFQVEVWSDLPTPSTNTFLYQYKQASPASQSGGTLQIFTGAAAQTGLTELANGNIPAAVSGDSIKFHAMFIAGQ